MKIYLMLLILVAFVRPFYATTPIERLEDKIMDLKDEKDDAEEKLFQAEKLEQLYLFMTTDPKSKTLAEWEVINNRVGQYTLDSSNLKAGTSLMINYPRHSVDKLIDVWARKYDIPAVDADAMKVEALGEMLLKDQIKAKRFAFTKGQGGEVSTGKMVVKKRDDSSVDICLSLETFKFSFEMEKVTVPHSTTSCGYFLFWRTHCRRCTWVEIKFKDKSITQKEQMDLADWMDHRLSDRFINIYKHAIARQGRQVKRWERKMERLQEKIERYEKRLEELEQEK